MTASEPGNEFHALSKEQLRDLVDSLRQPLQHRQVLLPVGRQAFFAAELVPDVDESQQELVQVALDNGSSEQMTRLEARNLLEKQYGAMTAKGPSNNKEGPSCKATSIPATKKSSTGSSSMQLVQSPQFLDIREEIDEHGNPTRGEVIDLSQSLQELENAVQPDNNDVSSSEVESEEEQNISLRQLNDDEYSALAARLDELALLEDKAEELKAESQRSRAKITGNTWTKGFLNKSPRTNSKPADGTKPTSIEASPQRRVPRRVSFTEDGPQVKEISRVGERSIKEVQQAQEIFARFKKPTGWSKGFLNDSKEVNGDSSNKKTIAFDEEVTVQEIPKNAPVANDSFKERPAIHSFDERVFSSVVTEHVATELQPQEPPEEKKKLSRFAQQRMEAR
jgi:hypothetical protein